MDADFDDDQDVVGRGGGAPSLPRRENQAVAAYTKGRNLHLLATADNQKWWRVIRTLDGDKPIHTAGKWVSPSGTANKFFEEVEFLGAAEGGRFLTLVSV